MLQYWRLNQPEMDFLPSVPAALAALTQQDIKRLLLPLTSYRRLNCLNQEFLCRLAVQLADQGVRTP
jgi:hypothetical protein